MLSIWFKLMSLSNPTGQVYHRKHATAEFVSNEVFKRYNDTIMDIMNCDYYGQQSPHSLKRAVKVGYAILDTKINNVSMDIDSIDFELLKSSVGVFFDELKRDFPEYFI